MTYLPGRCGSPGCHSNRLKRTIGGTRRRRREGQNIASSVLPHAVASHGVRDPEDEAVSKRGDYLHSVASQTVGNCGHLSRLNVVARLLRYSWFLMCLQYLHYFSLSDTENEIHVSFHQSLLYRVIQKDLNTFKNLLVVTKYHSLIHAITLDSSV